MAYERWLYGDPARIYERKQEQARKQAQKAIRKAAINPFEEKMTDDQSADIDHLIQEWHYYERRDKPQLGVPPCSVYAKDYRTSDNKRYGDDASEDSDMALLSIKAEAVAACVHELPAIHQHAIQNWLRNRRAKAEVFRNPRLGTPAQAIQLYIDAKALLLPMLRRRELVR